MKKLILNLTLLCCISATTSNAQSIIPASTAPGSLSPTVTSLTKLNCAYSIEYSGGYPNRHDFAVIWDDGTGGLKINIGNDVTGPISTPISIAVPSGYVSVSKPDIAIGTESGGFTSYFWMGVTFVATDASGNQDIFLNVYQMHSSLSGAFSNTPIVSTVNIPLSSSGQVQSSPYTSPHIDVITASVPSGSTSAQPHSGYFVVTWVEQGQLHVLSDFFRDAYDYYMYSTLSNAVQNTLSLSGNNVFESDIAGIQRNNTSSIDRMGLLAFTDEDYNLYYAEWNVTANSFSSPNMVSNSAKDVRIDAIDPYTMNNPSSAIAHYNISYRDGNVTTMIYNDLIGIETPINTITSFPYYTIDNPTVAYGPGSTYTIAYEAFTGGDEIFAQQVAQSTGSLCTADFYTVNNAGDDTYFAGPAIAQEANSVSTPGSVFVCWWDAVHSNIKYKTSSSTPITFKPSNQSVDEYHSQAILYPNPAHDKLHIENTGKEPIEGYQICDILGRVIVSTTTKGENQLNVDINNLDNGHYTIKLLSAKKTMESLQFVKY